MKKLITFLACLLLAANSLVLNAQSSVIEQWVQTYVNADSIQDVSIKVDAHHCILVLGTSTKTGKQNDVVLLRYAKEGTLLWAAEYDNPFEGGDRAIDLIADENCNSFVLAARDSSGFIYTTLLKFDSSGTKVWEVLYNYPGSIATIPNRMALDSGNNLIITGLRQDPVTHIYSAMTVKFDGLGNLLWEKIYDPLSFGSGSNAIVTDNAGNIYITGWYRTSDMNNDDDIIVVKYDPDGNLAWSRNYSGSGLYGEAGRAIGTDAAGNIYAGGNVRNTGTEQDWVILKYSPSGSLIWERTINGTNNQYDFFNALLVSGNDVYASGTTSNIGLNNTGVLIRFDSDGNMLWKNEREYYSGGYVAKGLNGEIYQLSGYALISPDYNVTAFDQAGNILWEQTYDGVLHQKDVPTSFSVDNENNVYVTGYSAVAGSGKNVITGIVTVKYGEQQPPAPIIIIDSGLYTYAEVYKDTIVHLLWDKHPDNSITEYIIEKSIDGVNFNPIDYIETANMIDIMTLPDSMINSFNNINYTTESTPRFIYNDIILNSQEFLQLRYRIKMNKENDTVIYTKDIIPSIYQIVSDSLPPVQLMMACPSEQTPPSGYINTGISYLGMAGCCVVTYSLYATSYTPGCTTPGPCYPSFSQINPVKDCTHECSYDPCCQHLGADYIDCDCNKPWPSCNASSSSDYEWVITNVENLDDLAIVPADPEICEGESITLSLNMNLPQDMNVLISWNTGASTPSITVSPTTTTTYSVAVFYLGCYYELSTTVTVNTPPIIQISTVNSCGQSNGSATVNIVNGIAPFTYLWSNGATSPVNTALGGGTYNITVTDANNCSTTGSIDISEFPLPIVNATSMSTCQGQTTGNIAVAVAGGTPPFSYLWSNGATTQNLTGLAPGTYTVTVTDNNSCSASASSNVNSYPAPAANAGADATICGNQIILGSGTLFNPTTATGGVSPYTYNWSVTPSGGTLSANNTALTIFTYSGPTKTFTASVTVTDANGCTATDQKVVTVKTAGQCCAEAYAYTYKSITVNNNVTANCTLMNGTVVPVAVSTLFTSGTATFSVKESITVNAPASIVINSKTIKFGPDGNMIVRIGAHVRVSQNSILTAIGCPTVMWQGIFVEGNPNAHQLPNSNQGWFTIQDNATIREAHAGIRNFYGLFSSGGVIQAINANFINNRYSVVLFPYKYKWGDMLFRNCLFETNAPMKDDIMYAANSSHLAFIWMWGQFYKTPLLIESNTFTVTAPSILSGLNARGYGIQSYDSEFTVRKASGSKGANIFRNLDAGIDINRGINNAWSYAVLVHQNNIFENNRAGIKQTGNSGTGGTVKIGGNTFTQTVFYPPTGPAPYTIGIYNNGIGKIDILENSFSKHTVGIYSDNSTSANLSSTQHNNAWKNTFNNCGRGLEFTKDNSRFQVLCNTFNNGLNNAQAYWVVNNGNVKNPQGGYSNNTCTFADNTFGTPTPPKKDIRLARASAFYDPSFTYFYSGTIPTYDAVGCSPPCLNMQMSICTGSKVSACNSQPQKVSGGTAQQIAQQLGSATNQQQRLELIQEMISALTENDKLDSIIPFLESVPDTEAKWMLVPEYISVKRYTDAETVLNNLAKDNLEKQKKDEYYKVHIDLGKTDRIPTDMTAVEKSTVEQVAASETEISYNAKAMLHFWYGNEYPPELADLGTSSNRMANTENTEEQNTPFIVRNENTVVSSLYPSPNDGNMKMDFIIAENSNAVLKIYDLTGRIIETHLLTGSGQLEISNNRLTEGIYLYEVISDETILIKNKLVIIK